ncbi:hypothetical protein [Frigidibacter oleivorans]|uniref:hypothetical protein n=1 Tax=Frigidibacter oleivorans TaxID=2487129 RepID=UPI000F8F1014|nr:hypothetical protein [Frigidibacter oleivorans]
MISRLAGAAIRAGLVVVMIATPSVLTQSVTQDTAEVVALVALFAAALTFFEYASTYPGLVEFRDAPPFNRIRFCALFLMVFLLSVVCMQGADGTLLMKLVKALGGQVSVALDFPYSPVRLMTLSLSEQAPPAQVDLVRTTAGVAYGISMVTMVGFVLGMRAFGWPASEGSFNVWINLPTFDPTTGGDVVDRLQRDAVANVALGFVLPFLIPAVVKSASIMFAPLEFASAHTLVWAMTAWAFLPLSLLMRGIAMGRVAAMIVARRKMHAEMVAGMQPA